MELFGPTDTLSRSARGDSVSCWRSKTPTRASAEVPPPITCGRSRQRIRPLSAAWAGLADEPVADGGTRKLESAAELTV